MLRDVASRELGNRRDVFVYLPPSYAHGARELPVPYMHDGQDLFDEEASHAAVAEGRPRR
jgi:predicted alpha/beta superfamily hydrolase